MAMANSKKTKKKPSNSNHDDIDALKSDVASFASSLGLSSSLPSSGFNDTDFTTPKKSQPLHTHQQKTNPEPKNNQNKHTHFPKTKHKPPNKPNKPFPNPPVLSLDNVNDNNDNKGGTFRRFRNDNKPNKPSVLSLDNGNDNNDNKGGIFRRFRNVPRVSLVKASDLGVWYVDLAELEERVVKGDGRVGIEDVEEWKRVCERKREMGERLMGQYVEEYEGTRGQSGDIRMLVNTQRSGTAVDKVSAFSVLVGDNPVANLRSLDALLGMVTSKVGKRHALTGFEALQELFVSSLLPDRKLKTLIQRPLNHLPDNKDGHSLLLFWYFEECLKQRYERFVIALEEASKDMLPILKNKAIKSIYVLLRSKSEQERRLLSALVNKLGDPDNKAASNADFHLSNLMSDHPNMKGVVIDEVDTFLFRPHLGPRAQYHVVNFLSQIRLSHRGDGPKVAKRLVDVYFALFKVLISGANSNHKFDESKKDINKKAGKSEKSKDAPESHAELDSRLLSALLTGVNRAFPFVSSDEADDIVDAQTPVLFQLVHSKNFNVGLQALMLLDKISSKNQIASDRFYRALYSKLLLPAAMHTSKVEMFIGLILRAMKRDVNLKRVAAFSKRLLQMALQQPAQFACACLFLLSELLKARPPLWNLMLQNESIDDEVEHFEDVKEETDPAATNKQADVGPVQNGDDHNSEDESSEKEDDLPKSSESEDDSDYASEEADFALASNEKVPENSKHVSDDEKNQSQSSSNKSLLPGGYDPRHREPSFCNADRVSWWELIVLASHSHPSVATMARTLLSGANIVYNGNPLNDLSLTAFLDKFMEKKPKQSLWHGGSQIEPAKQMGINNHLIGPEILSLAEEDVQPEDLVFHKFYTNKMHSSKRPKKKKKKTANEEAAEDLFDVDGSDVDVDGGDESDNEEIENLLDDADQSLGGDGEYDYDDLDKVADEDDEDLIGDVSDGDMEAALSDIAEEFSDTPMEGDDDDVSEDEDDIDIGDVDDDSDADAGEEAVVEKRKTKGNKKSSASPFASYEDYEHLMEDDNQADDKRTEEPSSQKKRKRKTKTKKDDDNKTEEPSSKKSKSKKKRR